MPKVPPFQKFDKLLAQAKQSKKKVSTSKAAQYRKFAKAMSKARLKKTELLEQKIRQGDRKLAASKEARQERTAALQEFAEMLNGYRHDLQKAQKELKVPSSELTLPPILKRDGLNFSMIVGAFALLITATHAARTFSAVCHAVLENEDGC